MKRENFVDYGKYLNCNLSKYWGILQGERIRGEAKTWHHVFTGKLKNGAWEKKRWSNRKLKEEYKEFGLDIKEGVYLAASIHSVLNQLLRNCSPPAIFENLNCIFDSKSIDPNTKEYFTKLVLYIVEKKLERAIADREYCSLEKINKFVEDISRITDAIHIDVNNGNEMKIESIMSCFGVTRGEIVSFLTKNFLPKDWTKYPPELWDLYLQ